MSEAELLDELPIALSFIDCIEVFALKILNQCELQVFAISDFANEGRNSFPAKAPSSAETPLAGNELEFAVPVSQSDRLQEPTHPKALLQFGELGVIETLPWLVWVGRYRVHGHVSQ